MAGYVFSFGRSEILEYLFGVLYMMALLMTRVSWIHGFPFWRAVLWYGNIQLAFCVVASVFIELLVEVALFRRRSAEADGALAFDPSSGSQTSIFTAQEQVCFVPV